MNPLVFTKWAGRVFTVLAAITSILFAVGCGSGNGFTKTNPVGFSNSSLSGTYVLSISGTDVNVSANTASFFAIVGTISADGKGNIQGGTVDINDADLGGTGVFVAQALSPSTYTIGADGRGTGTLVTPVGKFGVDFVLSSNSHGLISRFDAAGSGSGTLDLQGSASQSALGSLAFSLSGVDSSGNSVGTVGGFTLNSSGTITSGSGLQDLNDNGSSAGLTALPLTGSVVLGPGGTSGIALLTNSSASFGSLGFDVWVIDSAHLKFIETDTAITGNALAGDAFTQQTSFPAGQLVFTLGGLDSTLNNPLAVGGFVTTDANGTLSNGTEDYNDAVNANTVTNVSGSCSAPAPFPSGRCQLSLKGFSNGALQSFIFAAYPSSGGIQLLEIDSLGLMQGAAYSQTATSLAASEGYGLNLSGANFDPTFNSYFEVDNIAQFNASSPTSTPNLIGVLDENDLALQLVSATLSGTYMPDSPATGRGSITVPSINTFIRTLNLEYYVVDGSTVLFIEGDANQVALGTFGLQSPSSAAAVRPVVSMIRRAGGEHAALRRK